MNKPDTRQTYEEYLGTMRAYCFVPMQRELWQDWQVFHHGSYKPSTDTPSASETADGVSSDAGGTT
jgi:hypothetical protein